MRALNVLLDWFVNTNHAGFFVALHKNYYSGAGLDVNIYDNTQSIGGNGAADITIAPQPSILTGMDKGNKVTAVATLTQRNDSGILSLKQEGISNPKDLEGKRLSYWKTAWFDSIIGKAVNENGGNYSNVRLIQKEVGDIEASLGTEVDAVWIYKSWEYFVMQHAGIPVNYFELADYGSVYDYCAPAVVATHELIDSAPNVLSAFLEQTRRGYVEAVKDPDAAAEILVQYMEKADKRDPELVRDSLRYISTRFLNKNGQWGYIEPARWNALADYMVEQTLIKGRMNREFTNDFLKSTE